MAGDVFPWDTSDNKESSSKKLVSLDQGSKSMSVEVAQERISRTIAELEKMKPKVPEWLDTYYADSPLVKKGEYHSGLIMSGAGIVGMVSIFTLPLFLAIPTTILGVALSTFILEAYHYGGKAGKRKQSMKRFTSDLFLAKKQRVLADNRSIELSYYYQAIEARKLLIKALRQELERDKVFEALRIKDPLTGKIEQLYLSDDGEFEYVTEEPSAVGDIGEITSNKEAIESMVHRIKESLDKVEQIEP